ncbi:MAG TPA: DNA primase [Prolixibacteraceae bacterium]|nr:DNA primase [Prolixibacteraceae bacterium]
MIEQATIERILDASEIVEVVSDFVNLKRRGVNYLGNCPFHNEKTPSFTVSPAKGIFKCFGCGKGGNAVNFIMEHESLSYPEALKWLARKYHIEIVEKEESEEERQQKDDRESMMIVSGFAQKYFSRFLWEEPEGRTVGLGYFRERGFREDIVKKFELGFCPDGKSTFTDAAQREGYRMEFLEKTGLTIKRDDWVRDRFSGRVMFPIHNLAGRVIAFGGRILKHDPNAAKYLNSPESEIYHKSRVLYGIFQAKREIMRADKCFLVEGYTDVLSLHQAGIENVVASSGTALTPDQIRLIRRFTPNVTILYDGDEAGIKASLRGIDLVLEEGLNVKVLLLPGGEDPDSFARKHNATELLHYIAENETDFIQFKTRLLLKTTENDPVARAKLITDVLRSVSVIPDTIMRSVYIRECSKLLNVDESILYNEVRKILRHRSGKAGFQLPPDQPAKAKPQVAPPTPQPAGLDTEEQELLRILLKYCKSPLFEQESETPGQTEIISVGYFILAQLINDDLVSDKPEFKTIIEEMADRLEEDDFQPDRYFFHHPDARISRLAIDLLAEKWVESKRWSKAGSYTEKEEDILEWLVPKIVNEYKLRKVKYLLADIEKQIAGLTGEDDFEKVIDAQSKYMNLKKVEKFLADRLGNRTMIS